MINPKVNFAGFLLGVAALCLGAVGTVLWFLSEATDLTTLILTILPIIIGLTVIMFTVKNRKMIE